MEDLEAKDRAVDEMFDAMTADLDTIRSTVERMADRLRAAGHRRDQTRNGGGNA